MSLFAGVRKFHDGEEATFEGSYRFADDMVTGQFPAGYARSRTGHMRIHAGGDHDAFLLVGTRELA